MKHNFIKSIFYCIICAIIVAILSGVIVWTKQNKKTKRKTSSTPLVENVVKPNNKSIKYVKFGWECVVTKLSK